MFKNVLVGVDGTANGRDAIALASRLDRPRREADARPRAPRRAASLHAIIPALRQRSARRPRSCWRTSAPQPMWTRRSSASWRRARGAGLHGQAEEQGADLLVVGSCSHGALGRAMLGDDTRAALNGAPCAVAIAPVGYAERIRRRSPRWASHTTARRRAGRRSRARASSPQPTARRSTRWKSSSCPSYAYTGSMPPRWVTASMLMLREASERMGSSRTSTARRLRAAGEELAAFGDEVDLLVVGSRGYGPSSVWFSAAPPTTWSATRAARCSCCRARRPRRSPPLARRCEPGHRRSRGRREPVPSRA